MVSPIITPFRWYDQHYHQYRFCKDCAELVDPCEYSMITDKQRLPPFQFTRKNGVGGIDNWVLRPSCNPLYKEVVTEVNRNFVTGSMTWDVRELEDGKPDWKPDCGLMSANTTDHTDGVMTLDGVLIPSKKYTIRIAIIDFFDLGGSMALEIRNDGNLITTKSGAGCVEFEFTPTSDEIEVWFKNAVAGNILKIESISCQQEFEVEGEDVVLDSSLIYINNLGGQDRVVYCGEDFLTQLPAGTYYSIIETEGELYISEVIKVEDFIYSRSPYVILEWGNGCDINGTIYHDYGGCVYKNRLYIDGPITKPEYPIEEDGEEDGDGNFNPIFQKWDKEVQLIIPKAPEYLVDALSAIQLHDTIDFYRPLKIGQFCIDEPENIKRVEHDKEDIIEDCFSTSNLKLTLDTQKVDSTCCDNNAAETCHECTEDNTIPAINTFQDGVVLLIGYIPGSGEPDVPDGAYYYDTGSGEITPFTQEENESIVICDDSNPGLFWAFTGIIWELTPVISSITKNSNQSYVVNGKAIPGTFVTVEYSFVSGTGPWIPYSGLDIDAESFNSGGYPVDFPSEVCCEVWFRFKMSTMLCDYGYSNSGNSTGNGSCC